MAATILIADDDRSIRHVVGQALEQRGHRVRAAADAGTLWKWVAAGEGDLVITDVLMPDENGLDLIPRIRERRPGLPVIVMSAQNTIMTAIRASERGAFEYLPKPFDLRQLLNAVDRGLAQGDGNATLSDAPPEEALPIIGRSAAMQEVYRIVARLVNTDMTVLIHGESGTGKELVARALHDYGRRRLKPFVAINMAAIPRDLVESELFGHEKGAFTGAIGRGIGRFEQADGGTLFLDEIGDMPMEAQTRLLRVLQTGEFQPVGGRDARHANLRVIAATHRDLHQLIAGGRFREDLFYRLNVVPIHLPALRDRCEDLPDLARHFLHQARREGLGAKNLTRDALEFLGHQDWPGNVRELENLIRRITVLRPETSIDASILRAAMAEQRRSVKSGGSGQEAISETLGQSVERHLRRYFDAHQGRLPARGLYDRILREMERPLFELCLNATRGNQIKAAELLGLNRNTLRRRLRDLDMQPRRRGSPTR